MECAEEEEEGVEDTETADRAWEGGEEQSETTDNALDRAEDERIEGAGYDECKSEDVVQYVNFEGERDDEI